jgi:hypothetical protein
MLFTALQEQEMIAGREGGVPLARQRETCSPPKEPGERPRVMKGPDDGDLAAIMLQLARYQRLMGRAKNERREEV